MYLSFQAAGVSECQDKNAYLRNSKKQFTDRMFGEPMMPDHHYRRLVDGDIIKVKIQNIFMILFDFEEYSCGGHHFGVRLFASWSYSNSNNSRPKDPV